MMNTYKDIKVKAKRNWLGILKFSVVELEIEGAKPFKVIKEVALFKGSTTDCESYLRLIRDKNIL
jgi:hypothetical protein